MTATTMPLVLGDPARIESFLEPVAGLVARGPSETFADAGVQRLLSRLSRLGDWRTGEVTGGRPAAAAKEVNRWPSL